MIRLLLAASIHIRDFMRRYMPSNIVLDLIRTRVGLKWGVPAMLLAILYFGAAYWCTTIIGAGGPGWLNLVVLICAWSGFKMLWIGPVSIVLLLRVRSQERLARRATRRNQDALVGSGVA
ncbi:MAG: sulfate permease [Dermabacter sp.]|nr:sulfate permease [Dermabacter sp.]